MIHYLYAMEINEQFDNLRNELNKTKTWPIVYMFKFIIPADNKKQALVESKFSDESVITKTVFKRSCSKIHPPIKDVRH